MLVIKLLDSSGPVSEPKRLASTSIKSNFKYAQIYTAINNHLNGGDEKGLFIFHLARRRFNLGLKIKSCASSPLLLEPSSSFKLSVCKSNPQRSEPNHQPSLSPIPNSYKRSLSLFLSFSVPFSLSLSLSLSLSALIHFVDFVVN
ncbi:hypothetical protein CIPAW_15G164800 [Carya illinoinensis]|uniref:Uncharacterized protein n=1 Tax=Carya illinoinensis TaxID=32201 RepID=A0A8T1N881_CARIL|nr:hypothetical protein CIPAW_15G164800 [Carya illinoinensis]